MKKSKKNLSSIILCLFELLIGIVLLVDPTGLTVAIIKCIGAALLVVGIICVIKYFRTDVLAAAQGQHLLKGLLALIAGGFCILNAQWFVLTFPILTMIYGIATLVTGVFKIQLAVDMLRMKGKMWWLTGINAAVSIICAVIILNNPFTTTAVLWTFTGCALIAEAVFDIITGIMGSRNTAKEA